MKTAPSLSHLNFNSFSFPGIPQDDRERYLATKARDEKEKERMKQEYMKRKEKNKQRMCRA